MDRNCDRKRYWKNRNFNKNSPGESAYSREDNQAESSSAGGSGFHPDGRPKHLKGREIGLYYAKKFKNYKERGEEQKKRPIATILLSQNRKTKIRKLLEEVTVFNISSSSSYNNYIQDSKFKTDFLNIISGTIEAKLNKNISIVTLKRDEILDEQYYNEFIKKTTMNVNYKEMLHVRKELPSYAMRHEILNLVKSNQVVVISGETGCGKTTQVTQFILDDYILSKKGSICNIVCTQPRRISAISVAERVAKERGERCGESSVGFHIRLEKQLPRNTCSITYCTAGIILKQMEIDPLLSDVSHLILDEIHERDIISDFVISLMKLIITRRTDLKLILMSATLNADQFAKYYDNCAFINIPGLTYPVTVYYLEDVLAKTKYDFAPESAIVENPRRRRGFIYGKNKQKQSEYAEFIEPYVRNIRASKKYSNQVCNNLLNSNSEQLNLKLILKLLIYICNDDNDGSILIFLPGIFEITTLNNEILKSDCFPSYKYLIISLHSKLPSIQQRTVFDRPPKGMRKIILSTNIAETSITIDDIIYVIDCGKIKMSSYDVEKDLETLNNEWVSVANANQRKGRAGRVQTGVCYHLFTKPRLLTLESFPKPEIQRSRLESVMLSIKILQLGKAENFLNKFMDPPNPKAIENAIRLLKHMNALDTEERLTPLGYHLARLPVNPRMGKMMLLGALFSCLDPILSIAVSLDFKDAFQYPLNKDKQVNEKKKELLSGWKSDHLLLAEAIRQYEEAKAEKKEKEFCWEYFLSRHTLELLCQMKIQFANYLYDMKFISNRCVKSEELNQNSNNYSLIKALVCGGLYPNVAIIRKMNRKGMVVHTTARERVILSRNSVNDQERVFESPLLVYYMKQKVTAISLYDTTMVHPLPLLFFGDDITIETENENESKPDECTDNTIISLSSILRFKCTNDTAVFIKELREKLDDLLKYKISHPGPVNWLENNAEVKVLRAIMELITCEDLGDIDISEADDDFNA